MNKIMVEMTLEEARDISKTAIGADPLGIFTGALIKRIEVAAKAAVAEMNAEKPPIPLDTKS
jgi:hypothetical protein